MTKNSRILLCTALSTGLWAVSAAGAELSFSQAAKKPAGSIFNFANPTINVGAGSGTDKVEVSVARPAPAEEPPLPKTAPLEKVAISGTSAAVTPVAQGESAEAEGDGSSRAAKVDVPPQSEPAEIPKVQPSPLPAPAEGELPTQPRLEDPTAAPTLVAAPLPVAVPEQQPQPQLHEEGTSNLASILISGAVGVGAIIAGALLVRRRRARHQAPARRWPAREASSIEPIDDLEAEVAQILRADSLAEAEEMFQTEEQISSGVAQHQDSVGPARRNDGQISGWADQRHGSNIVETRRRAAGIAVRA